MEVYEVFLSSLVAKMRVMHSLYTDAVDSMNINHVNYVERQNVLPIAFSLFHFVQIEDFSASMLGAGEMIYSENLGKSMGLTILDSGKEKTVEEMSHQSIGNYDVFKNYMKDVFFKTESWLKRLKFNELTEIKVQYPYPPSIASTYSARVGGEYGITRLTGIECWIYQHGLRHMGEIEHSRSLVGLKGMTS